MTIVFLCIILHKSNIAEGRSIYMDNIKVSIIGATGYVGAELVRGFVSHPVFEIKELTSRSFAGKALTSTGRTRIFTSRNA